MNKIVPEISRCLMQELVDEQRKEYRLAGSQKRIPGLILFEYDLTTGELKRASVKRELQITVDGRINKSHRVDSKDLCLYVQAINESNAKRKVMQLLKRKNIRNQILNLKKNA